MSDVGGYANREPMDGDVWSKWELVGSTELDRLHLNRLNEQLSYLARQSPFYRRKFEEVGRRAGPLKSLEELAEFPFTDKAEIRDSLASSPPLGEHCAAPLDTVVQRQVSSGTTGVPSYMAYTERDLESVSEMQARCFYAAGFRPRNLVLHAFAMSKGFVGGLPMCQAVAYMGMSLLPVGAESGAERIIQIIRAQRPAAVFGAPSFLEYLGEFCNSSGGGQASDLSIERIVVGSEIGGGVPATRAKLETLWGASVREMYGLSDLANGFWAECRFGQGMHFTGQGFIHPELVDPGTLQPIPLTSGAIGELVYSALGREATPLLRFRSYDLIEVVGEDCPCGRTSPQIRVLGRTDDMFIVRGINVYPSALKDVLNSLSPVATGKFRIVKNFKGHSTAQPLHLKVEVTGDFQAAARQIETALKARLNIRAKVEPLEKGALQDPPGTKARIVEDVSGE
ncbi:phenylacetate--CoA ligase family protein [Oceanibacterium hippocampi]|uniref:Phenylacetate-coenzyme A ligase n=1 Tax=Oceanibacterium hippocampi TaxID=745714 RepID=A0A1Y5TL73_9PROT|nr:AMP-binding protein [Oceanibacterium hippocampi]SLN66749.1 Phenylacetate-coenzyme A ligase [Oceanibacterium hippocampi]